MCQFEPGHLSSQCTKESDLLSSEPVETQSSTQEYCDISVVDMCRRVCEELEKNLGDSTAFIISSEWLEKWQSDDDEVYTRLLNAGYVKTFEADTYACFEKLLGTSSRGCFHGFPTYDPCQRGSDHEQRGVESEETIPRSSTF